MTRTLEESYRRHGPTVLRRAARLLGDEDAAWEVVHDVFLALLDCPEQFQERSSLSTWLYSATTHRCLNRLRDGRTRQRSLATEPIVALASSGADPETLTELRRVLARLPPELAQVAVYFHLDRMTYDETAEVMRCSRRHVADLLARLRRHLPERITSEDGT